MTFLTFLFTLLGLQGDAQTDPNGAMVGGDGQDGIQANVGGVIIVNG